MRICIYAVYAKTCSQVNHIVKKIELYGNNVLATQKLVLEELGQVSVDLEGNSGKDAFL